MKRWIAHSSGFTKGRIHLNERAVNAICGDRAVSVLPVGITSVEGEFEKDDLIGIVAPDGTVLGVGRSAYSSEQAREMAGLHGHKPIIHYDYLYLEQI